MGNLAKINNKRNDAVGQVGLEPTLLTELDLKSSAATITPLALGFETFLILPSLFIFPSVRRLQTMAIRT